VTDEPFDDIDRALAHGLSALAPDVDSGAETLAALRPRFRRARTRRRVAGVGVSLVALAAIGSVAVIAAPDSGRSHVHVSGPPSTRGKATTTTSSTSVSSTTRPGTSPPRTPTNPSGHSPGTSNPTRPSQPAGGVSPSPTTVPGTGPDTGHGGPGPSGGGGGDNGKGGSGPTKSVPTAAEMHSYRSAGGNVTVRFAHGQLELLSSPAAAGYHASVGSRQPDDVDVRFDSDQGDGHWRIRVRVDHEGHLSAEVTQS
jgi:cytoskeletal protein RodZ